MRHYILISVVLFASVAAGRAQEASPSQAVIRTETRLVLVDAVVTDKSGNYVRDLSAKDFHLWDDSKEQTITSVSLEAKPSASSKRYLVLYFDNYTLDTNTQPRVKEAALKLLSQEGAEDRMTAIAEFNGSMKIVQNFTSDTGRLKRIVERIGPPAGRLAGDASSGLFDQNASRGGGTRATQSAGRMTSSADATQTYDSEAEVEALGVLARNLAAIPGRKAIILMTGGLQQVRFSKLQAAIDACNQANVAVYAVNVRGVDSRAIGTQQVTDTVARSTGGFVAPDSNDLLPGLQKIAAEEHGYYMIGYSPTEPPTGRCHGLRVRVDRDGVNVRARSNYCDSAASDALAGTPAGKELEARMEGTQGGAAAAFMQAPFFYSLPNIARVNLALEVPPGVVRVDKVKGKPRVALNILAIASQKNGDVAARFSKTVNLDFKNQKEADAFSKMPFRYDGQFRVAAGTYNLKVAFSQQDGAFGRLEAPLVIEPFDGTGFAMSAIALSKEMRELAPSDANLDLMLLGDRTPLVLNGVQFIPSAVNRLTREDEAHVFAEIYEPQLLGETPPAVTARLVIIDKKTGEQRRSQPMNVTAQARPGTNVIPVAMRLPLKILAPGAYRAELQAVGASGKTASRSVDFELQP